MCKVHRVFRAHTVDDINPALPSGPQTMGIMVESLSWAKCRMYIISRSVWGSGFRVQGSFDSYL